MRAYALGKCVPVRDGGVAGADGAEYFKTDCVHDATEGVLFMRAGLVTAIYEQD